MEGNNPSNLSPDIPVSAYNTDRERNAKVLQTQGSDIWRSAQAVLIRILLFQIVPGRS